MTDISFHPLSEIPAAELVCLLNDPDVRPHMPLAAAELRAPEGAGPPHFEPAGEFEYAGSAS